MLGSSSHCRRGRDALGSFNRTGYVKDGAAKHIVNKTESSTVKALPRPLIPWLVIVSDDRTVLGILSNSRGTRSDYAHEPMILRAQL
jgi:hypothetical protein